MALEIGQTIFNGETKRIFKILHIFVTYNTHSCYKKRVVQCQRLSSVILNFYFSLLYVNYIFYN